MIRRRLLLAITLTVMVAIGVASWLVVTSLEHRLIANVDEQFVSGGLSIDVRQQLAPDRINPRQPDLVDDRRQAAVVVYGPSGGVLRSIPAGTSADPEPLPDGSTLAAADGIRTVHSIERGGPRYRAVAIDATRGSKIVVALSLSDVDATLDEARRVQRLIGIAAIAGVLLICWLLIRHAFMPIEGMITSAGRIAEGDLTERTAVTETNSEVGRLGTALNTMMDRIEHAVAETTASEERMRRFVADASHDLRTPLTSVRGYAELYRQAPDDPESVARSMDRIEEEATRMSRLVDDLLLLARLDQQRPPATADVDVGRVLGYAVDAVRVTDPDRTYDLELHEPAIVRGDVDQLRQVFDNLLSNARIHTPPGTTVDARVDTTDDGVRITIADDGPGFSPTDRERAFDRFWRSTRSDENPRKGSGLGLAIVASIVSSHGGRVALDTGPAGGARFTIVLPHLGDADPPQPE